jgi:peptide/nickel transport system ATP-binding protein
MAGPETVAAPPPGTAPPAVPLVEVRDLHVSFTGRGGLFAGKSPEARAVDGVDLAIGRGEIVALAGESGCGKTTLARTMMGLERPKQGEILFDGKTIGRSTRLLRDYRRRVQIVFQDPAGALNPRQTIYESVAEGLRIHKVPGDEEKLVAAALSHAGLRPPERFFLLYPHEVSGGQRQRVVIAGALALEPRLIVADEPVSALDASIRGEILRLLLKLRDELGLALLVVTHDLGLAWMIADRVAVMYLGRIVEIGPAEQVLTDPLHPYTKALLSVVPETKRMEQQILTGETPDPTRIPDGCRFHPRCPAVASGAASAAGVEQLCKGEDLGLEEIQQAHFAACHLVNAEKGGSPGA